MSSRVIRPVVGALALSALLVPLSAPAFADEIRDRQYWLADYGIEDAWDITRGAGVTIAIIDTGVDASHQDLEGTVRAGTDVSGIGSPDGQSPVGPASEHGTMVASLAVGRGHDDDAGVIGSAPEATILSVSMSFQGATVPADEQIANAVTWAVDNGADVISLSLTRNTREWPVSWDQAFGYAEQNDVVVVAAAGNRSSGTEIVGAPATMPGVLTVGGVDRSGTASATASSQGITIGVMAPSEDLVGAYPGGSYAEWAGTSGATPIVAGIVALVRAAYPSMDAANVINRVLATATPVTGAVPDPLYGYGLIDAYAAVTADVALVGDNPLGSIAEWVVVYRRGDSDGVLYPLGPLEPPRLDPPTRIGDSPQELAGGTTDMIPLYMVAGLSAALVLIVTAGGVTVFRASRKPLD